MSDLPALASAYAVFLACVAGVLAWTRRTERARAWPASEVSRFRLALARTLLVLAVFILVAAAIRAEARARSIASLASAALFSGAVGWMISPRRRA